MKAPSANTFRLVGIEFRRSVGLLLFPVLLAIGWWLSGDVMDSEAYVWIDSSAAIRYTTIFLGPMVGGVSAWVAGRNRRRGMTEMLSTTPYSTVSRDLGVWAGTALWGISAYALLAVLLGALTWWNATWGAPLPGYFLVGLVAMVFYSAVGYAAGYWLPSRFVPPIVAVGLFLLQLTPEETLGQEPRLELLTPAPNSLIYRDVFQEVPQIAVQQSLWFLGLAGVAIATVALKASRGNFASWTAFSGCLIVAVIGGVAAVGADQRSVDLFSGETVPFEYACKDGRIEVCLHPAYESLLPEIEETVNEIAKPLAGLSDAPTRAIQVGEYETTPPPDASDIVPLDAYSIKEGGSAPLLADSVAHGLVREGEGGGKMPEPTAKDLERCGKVEDREFLDPTYEAQELVAGWLLERVRSYGAGSVWSECPNSKQLMDRFADLEPSERRAWFDENLADLRAGKLALKDLP